MPRTETLPQAVITIFGAQGDLASRKIIPALGNMLMEGRLDPHTVIIGVGRRELSSQQFAEFCFKHFSDLLEQRGDADNLNQAQSDKFKQQFYRLFEFVSMDVKDAKGYQNLQKLVAQKRSKLDQSCAEIYYLSTHSELFISICDGLNRVNLLGDQARLVLEKPLGSCAKSAARIQQGLSKYLNEEQIFRIDHYLGKEAVQNLLALRLGNSFMESLWNRKHISHIEISAAEQLGIEHRGDFYDKTGAMRDMVQSHLLQLLSIVAMEAPLNRHHESIRDEKVKVLKSLRNMDFELVKNNSIRAQYRGGAKSVSFYEESEVASDSSTETFVALKCWVDNWRWSKVPFYLRTGKKMPERLAEIVVHFRRVPVDIFPVARGYESSQSLVIELNPNDRLSLYLMAKTPGDEQVLKPVELSLDFNDHFGTRPRDAYERLVSDVIRNDLMLFLRFDEVDLAWRWVDQVIENWQKMPETLQFYDSYSWGPVTSQGFLVEDALVWNKRLSSGTS